MITVQIRGSTVHIADQSILNGSLHASSCFLRRIRYGSSSAGVVQAKPFRNNLDFLCGIFQEIRKALQRTGIMLYAVLYIEIHL